MFNVEDVKAVRLASLTSWVQVFGAGLIASAGMFGITGLLKTPMDVEWRVIFTGLIFSMFSYVAFRVSATTLQQGLERLAKKEADVLEGKIADLKERYERRGEILRSIQKQIWLSSRSAEWQAEQDKKNKGE